MFDILKYASKCQIDAILLLKFSSFWAQKLDDVTTDL